MSKIPKEVGDTLATAGDSRREEYKGAISEASVLGDGDDGGEPFLIPPTDTLGTWTLLLPSLVTVFSEGMGPGSKFPPDSRPVIIFLF